MPASELRVEGPLPFPVRTLRLGIALMIAMLAGATMLTWRMGNHVRDATNAQVQVLMAAEKVAHYGTVLELSIRAVVDQTEAAAEYRRVQPELRSMLTVLQAQMRAEGESTEVSDALGGSQLKLMRMERRALDLAAAGNVEAARRIIDSKRYKYLVDIYSRGIQTIEQRAARHVETIRTQFNTYLGLIVAMSAASLILVILGWIVLILPVRRWGEQLERARSDAEQSARLLELKQLELERLNHQLFDQARTDTLTGLRTRLKLNEDIADLWPRLVRETASASVLICDIDYFKQYNDSCGHLAGDEVLRRVAAALQDVRRSGDKVYRLGGEEFLVLLHGCKPADATVRAEDYRRSVERLAIAHPTSPIRTVTVSVGVASMNPRTRTFQDWLKAADEAMYEAKSGGRNRVVTSLKLAA